MGSGTLQLLRLQRLRVVLHFCSATGMPPIFRMVAAKASRCTLVVALELQRNVEHGVLQQAAAGAQLVGADGLVLQAEGLDLRDLSHRELAAQLQLPLGSQPALW